MAEIGLLLLFANNPVKQQEGLIIVIAEIQFLCKNKTAIHKIAPAKVMAERK